MNNMNNNFLLTGMIFAMQFDSGHNPIQTAGSSKKKWTTLSHNGVMFPPPYVPHKVPIIYNGQAVPLDPEPEEIATIYAKFVLASSDNLKNSVFRKNFWHDWKDVLGPDTLIKDLAGCDFQQIVAHLLKVKEEKKIKVKEASESDAADPYKTAVIDGVVQPVGNFRMEPPGIFLGRGCNPNLGRVKRRIFPEDITINIGKESAVPNPGPGHSWGSVIHNRDVEWLASWKDDITGKTKYVWLGAHSDLKGRNDMEKFDLARKLKKKIKMIRAQNEIQLANSNVKSRQVATALYFIDTYALRVGNEKGDDDTDTVGITSLRVEHIELVGDNKIKLDFLGKDSVRYNRVLEVDPKVWANVSEFMTDKEMSDQLFDLISSSDINKYLQSYMKNLTAKVFRTFNASNLFQKELTKISKKYESYEEIDKINVLLDEFNKANGKVALLCNHQKNINKSNSKKMETQNEKIKKLKSKIRKANTSKKKNPEKIAKMKTDLKKLRAKKEMMIELKNISLGTSKVNYIDPRITVAFLKRHDIPIDKIFPKTLQEKFRWAFEAEKDYKF